MSVDLEQQLKNDLMDRMELVSEYPPCYEAVHKELPLANPKTSAFTYGNKIYVPEQKTDQIGATVLQHETQHSEQQDKIGSPEAWWEKWIADKEFRLEQEGEAYARQYWFFCANKKDRNARARMLHHLCANMSGDMYGRMCSYEEAKKIILNG